MNPRRPAVPVPGSRSTFLALLALLSILSFDASHLVHHLLDNESPASHDAGSHAWWDGVLFHTGTLVEPAFVAPIPAHRLVTWIHFDLPDRPDSGPRHVPESRAPPVA